MKNLKKVFEQQYFDLDKEIKRSYIDNGIGCLNIKVDDYYDIMNRYAGEGYECLNPEFYTFVDNNVQYIPMNVPILLQIYGCTFTKKQKESIIETIREYYLYKLGLAIEEHKASIKKLLTFFVLAILFLTLSIVTENDHEGLSTFLNLVFCFYGSSVITFFAAGYKANKTKRIRFGQLTNVYVYIDKELDNNPITDKDKEMIYSFLKKINEEEHNIEKNIK